MGFDPVSYILGAKSGGGGGGGNPNYVETIEGTAENPWGGLNPVDIQSEYQSDNSTVYAYVDGTPIGGVPTYAYMGRWGDAIGFYSISPGSVVSSWYGVWISYKTDGTLSLFKILANGEVTDLAQYASLLPMTITIIHHPLPEDNT